MLGLHTDQHRDRRTKNRGYKGLHSISHKYLTGGIDRLKKRAAAGVKRPTGPAGGGDVKRLTHIKRTQSRVVGFPHANITHNLQLWRWAIGRGCMCSVSAWQEGDAKLNGALFQFIK